MKPLRFILGLCLAGLVSSSVITPAQAQVVPSGYVSVLTDTSVDRSVSGNRVRTTVTYTYAVRDVATGQTLYTYTMTITVEGDLMNVWLQAE